MGIRSDYGVLVNTDAKLHRNQFKEMVKLIGVNVKYRSPINKDYTLHGEIIASNYTEAITVGCIFEEHINQKSAKLLGQNAELIESTALIHVPYDLANLQIGCLFEIPSGIDNTPARLFRVTKLITTMIYPASVSCEIVPEYFDTETKANIEVFKDTNFNLLSEG